MCQGYSRAQNGARHPGDCIVRCDCGRGKATGGPSRKPAPGRSWQTPPEIAEDFSDSWMFFQNGERSPRRSAPREEGHLREAMRLNPCRCVPGANGCCSPSHRGPGSWWRHWQARSPKGPGSHSLEKVRGLSGNCCRRDCRKRCPYPSATAAGHFQACQHRAGLWYCFLHTWIVWRFRRWRMARQSLESVPGPRRPWPRRRRKSSRRKGVAGRNCSWEKLL